MKIRQKRVLAYVLAMVMVLNLCAVPVKAETSEGSAGKTTDSTAEHSHSWEYEALDADDDGVKDTITAVCKPIEGSCNYQSKKVTMSLTFGNNDSITYDGQEHKAEIVATILDDNNKKQELSAEELEKMQIITPTLSYEKVVEGSKESANSEEVTLIDAGTYNVIASLKIDENTTLQITKEVTIFPYKLQENEITLNTSTYTWTGSEIDVTAGNNINVTATLNNEQKTLTSDTDYEITNNTQKAVGNHTVNIQGKGNYSGTVSKEWKIEKKSIDNNGNIKINESQLTKLYDGLNMQAPTINYNSISPALENAKILYYDNTNSNSITDIPDKAWKANFPECKNAGEYCIAYKITSDNYNDIIGTITLKINQKPVKIDWKPSSTSTCLAAGDDLKFFNIGSTQGIKATTNDFIDDEDVQIVYDSDRAYTYSSAKTGEYRAKIMLSGEDKENYTISDDSKSEQKWSIIDPIKIEGTKTNKDSDWYTSNVIVKPAQGYTISTDGGKNWNKSIEYKETATDVVYKLECEEKKFEHANFKYSFQIDKKEPEISSVSIKNTPIDISNQGSQSKKYFFKNNDIKGKITTADAGSGICSIKYCLVSSDGSIDESKLQWQTSEGDGSFSVSSIVDGKYRLYVQVTDNAGNTNTEFADGIVIYKELVVDPDSIDYTKGSNTSIEIKLTLNNNKFNQIKIDDKVLESNQYQYDNASATISIKGNQLDELSVGEHTIYISYNPCGEVYMENSGDKPEEINVSLKVNNVVTPKPTTPTTSENPETPTPTPTTPTASKNPETPAPIPSSTAKPATPPSITVEPGVTESPKANNISITVSVKGKVATPEQEYYLVANNKDSITISINATGAANYTYQWYMNDGTRIDGATSSTYKVKASKAGKNSYFCEVNGRLFDSAKIYITGYNNKLSVSKGKTITAKDIFGRNHAIKSISLIRKNQKKYLKLSKKSIKAKAYCRDIKVRINTGNAKLTVAITVVIPSPKFTVKINKARTRITFKIKNKSVAKKIGCYTIEASRKKAFSYVTTNKFILTNSNKFLKGKYSFRIRFWNTKKPVKKGKLLTKKYMYSEQVQKLKVR